MDKKMKIWIGVVIAIVIGLVTILGVKIFNKTYKAEEIVVEKQEEPTEEPVKEEKKNIKIFNGNSRPIAFMIDNNVNAQPQSSLNKAYLVYETRLMALFKGVDVSTEDIVVGPIRSARHYFIDYALENDAIYAHLGQSPQAESYVKNFSVADINGQIYDTGKARTSTSLFWRESPHGNKAPHNAYTSIGSLKQISKDRGYKLTSAADSVLNYVENEVNLQSDTDANTVVIPYASSHKVKYVYDEATKRYTRYSKGKLQKDGETGENITTKNIIISLVYNYSLDDGEGKGRQTLNNVGTANGYYITNGKASPILCQKDSRTGKTVYKNHNGDEIEVNDGNTFINIAPINAEIEFE